MTTQSDIERGEALQAALNQGLRGYYADGHAKLHTVVIAIPQDCAEGAIIVTGLPPHLAIDLLRTALQRAETDLKNWIERPTDDAGRR